MIDQLPDPPDDGTLQRVCSEFLEMPGLRITPRQAQRLWGLDEGTCLAILDLLVDAKFLCRKPPDLYARSTDGPAAIPRPRMAKAGIGAVRDDAKRAG